MKKLLSNLRIGMALFLAMFSTNLLPVAVAYAAPQPWTEPTNHVEYWQNLGHGVCTKTDYPENTTDKTYTMPTAPANSSWSLLVIKAAQVNEVYVNPTAGVTYNAPAKENGTLREISHIITCVKPAPLERPIAPVPTAPTCEIAGSLTLPADTSDIDWSITPTYTGPGTYTVTATALGGKVFVGGGTTVTFENIVVLPVKTEGCVQGATVVNPLAPTYKDVCGTSTDAIIKPVDTDQITYSLNGSVVTATLKNPDTHDFGTGASLNGYIVSQDGLTATYTVTYEFTNTPCVDVCPTTLSTNLSTNLNNNGWTVPSDAEYVNDGLKLNVSGSWDQSYISRSFTGNLSDLGSVIDIEASPLQYVGIHVQTSKGFLTYEEEPSYGGKWWSRADFGVADGMGYETFDTLENIARANPDVTVSTIYVLYTHPDASSTTLTSVTIGCTKYTFDKEEVVQEEKKTDVCHATGSATNPYELINVSVSAAYNGHLGISHQDGRDIIPPFMYQGTEYSQNWPSGQTIYENDCVVVDVCPTVEGIQTNRDDCGQTQGTTDVCPNIEGTQTTVPAGMTKNTAGNCVTAGGMGAGGVLGTSTTAQVLGTALPTELPATGGTSMPNPMLSLVAGVLTYLFLARRNKKLEA